MTSSVKVTIITGMCEGLNFLHSKDIVHQALKPDNIMIEHGSHRGIIDMGLDKFLLYECECMNVAYSAPEILQGQNQRNMCSDVWTMGKIIAEVRAMNRLQLDDLTPTKIERSLRHDPYFDVVSKMVVSSTAMRARMSQVIDKIRNIEQQAQGPNRCLCGRLGACGAVGDDPGGNLPTCCNQVLFGIPYHKRRLLLKIMRSDFNR